MTEQPKAERIAALNRQLVTVNFQLECGEQSDSSFYISGRRGRILDWKKQLLSDISAIEAEGSES